MPKISTTRCSLASSAISLKTQTSNPSPPSLTQVSLNQQVVVGRGRRGISAMASTSAVSMAVPPTYAAQKKAVVPSSQTFFKPLPLRASKKATASKPNSRFEVRASLKEKAVTGLTAAALTASLMVPDVAEAAVSPSLKNFLLSIAAGGVVVTAIVGAVIGVSNFDPVKRS